jgi:ribosomal protein S18 acetylase RimI-like enzyme
MRTIESVADLPADALLRWAAQDRPRGWASDDGRAFAVAGADLSLRDRLAVSGPAESLVPLVSKVLGEVGPTFRPMGARPAVAALAEEIPGVAVAGEFGWMDRTAPLANGANGTSSPRAAPESAARWLTVEEEPEVTELLMTGHPSSYATPGIPGVRRWAGVRDTAGHLTAVAADAWSSPTVGFLAGIAVHPRARGRGLGRRVFGFALAEALAGHGTAALMVDDENTAAIALYRAFGMTYRPVSAAMVGG